MFVTNRGWKSKKPESEIEKVLKATTESINLPDNSAYYILMTHLQRIVNANV